MLFINITVDSGIPHILVKRLSISPHVLLSIGEFLSVLVSSLHHLVKIGLGSIVVKPHTVFATKTLLFCAFLTNSLLKLAEVYTFISSIQILIVWTRIPTMIFFVKRMICKFDYIQIFLILNLYVFVLFFSLLRMDICYVRKL